MTSPQSARSHSARPHAAHIVPTGSITAESASAVPHVRRFDISCRRITARRGLLVSRSVISRTLDSVEGNARLAAGSVAEEIPAALAATDKDVEIGGAGLAAQAIELGLASSAPLGCVESRSRFATVLA